MGVLEAILFVQTLGVDTSGLRQVQPILTEGVYMHL